MSQGKWMCVFVSVISVAFVRSFVGLVGFVNYNHAVFEAISCPCVCQPDKHKPTHTQTPKRTVILYYVCEIYSMMWVTDAPLLRGAPVKRAAHGKHIG